MNYKQTFMLYFLGLTFIVFVGCASNSQVKRLNEKEITQQEQQADQARQNFYYGRYEAIPPLLEPLVQERTTSQPLYLCEMGASYLAQNDKKNAKIYVLDAYTSIESFFDPSSEKKAASLWGAEAGKVYKGEPYEQATLSLFAGLLLLEEGDVDNALSCFKNGQISDSDVQSELFQSDYGLLQLLEAKCYQMRNEPDQHRVLSQKAIDSFSRTHPLSLSRQAAVLAEAKENGSEETSVQIIHSDTRVTETIDHVTREYQNYYEPLLKPYNTLLLIWGGHSPEMKNMGQYGEERVIVKRPTVESHFEILLNRDDWHDTIRGFSNIGFQATTRGGREMDNVLGDQAEFKHATHEIGDAFLDAADDVSDPYATAVLLGAGLISHGLGAATNVKADVRCWKCLPEEVMVVPVQLDSGVHQIKIDCYDRNFRHTRSLHYEVASEARPFQFYNLVISSEQPPIEEPKDDSTQASRSNKSETRRLR